MSAHRCFACEFVVFISVVNLRLRAPISVRGARLGGPTRPHTHTRARGETHKHPSRASHVVHVCACVDAFEWPQGEWLGGGGGGGGVTPSAWAIYKGEDKMEALKARSARTQRERSAQQSS